MGKHPARSSPYVAAKPPGRRADHAHFAVCDVDGLGSGTHFSLQRRLSPDRRHQARLGDRQPLGQGLGGNLAGHLSPHRAGVEDGRGDLGRGAVPLSGAQRLHGRDLPHLLLFAARRRRGRDARHAVCSRRGHGESDRRAPARHPARSRLTPFRGFDACAGHGGAGRFARKGATRLAVRARLSGGRRRRERDPARHSWFRPRRRQGKRIHPLRRSNGLAAREGAGRRSDHH